MIIFCPTLISFFYRLLRLLYYSTLWTALTCWIRSINSHFSAPGTIIVLQIGQVFVSIAVLICWSTLPRLSKASPISFRASAILYEVPLTSSGLVPPDILLRSASSNFLCFQFCCFQPFFISFIWHHYIRRWWPKNRLKSSNRLIFFTFQSNLELIYK